MEAFAILAVLIVITLISFNKSRDPNNLTGNFLGLKTSTSSVPIVANNSTSISSNSSSYAKGVSLNTGNAAYVYQSYEEYITINNFGSEPIDITGWQLKNGKNNRAYDVGGSLKYFSSDIAVIPQGTNYISPFGKAGLLQNIVLKPGEIAIVTTGTAQPQFPYKISSFKENICSGYIESLPEYNFTPQLSYNCPRPANEPGVSGLSANCRQFIDRMSYCRTPEFNTRDFNGEICENCVDGTLLPNSCVEFIRSHFSYNGCIANHSSDPNFSLSTWRIFLGKGWEMWAERYETIELFDQLGRLVTKYSY